MSYDGPNQPVTPLADPYDAYRKLYGNVREKKQVRSVLDDLRSDLNQVADQLPEADRKLLIEHTKLVERMDKEYQAGSSLNNLVAKPPELPEGLRNQNDSLPQLGRLQIDMLVNSFVNDFARVATLQYTKSVGQAKMNWLDIDDAHHTLSHEPDKNKDAYDKLVRINTWFAEELAYLLKKLESTPEPGQKGSMLDHTLVLWTNELGRKQSHPERYSFRSCGRWFRFQNGQVPTLRRQRPQPLSSQFGSRCRSSSGNLRQPSALQRGPLDLS